MLQSYNMPYPVGHSLVGLAFAKKTKVNPFLAIVLASLSDVDYFFGIPVGNLLFYHQNFLTHTVLFTMLTSGIVWFYARVVHRFLTLKQLLGIFLILLSHVLLDLYMFPLLPYRIDTMGGTHGFWDFVFTFIINPDFLWNNLLDLAFYGAFYIILVKFIFKKKLI